MQAPVFWVLAQVAGGVLLIGLAALLLLIAAIWLRGWVGK
jgi:hypothetical protein